MLQGGVAVTRPPGAAPSRAVLCLRVRSGRGPTGVASQTVGPAPPAFAAVAIPRPSMPRQTYEDYALVVLARCDTLRRRGDAEALHAQFEGAATMLETYFLDASDPELRWGWGWGCGGRWVGGWVALWNCGVGNRVNQRD